jgi:formate hydrogenlyase subunit 3/multisubunit Na+/H+ antiporter MnhD subunit
VSLKGGRGQLSAALRYLLFALLGSVLYLLGAALLYGLHGTLDIPQLAQRLADPQTSGTPAWASLAALALMTVGLLAKTALVPLHLWLPPAHAGAPAPASAVLSALVVKGSFFLTVRLWMDLAPGLTELPAAQVLGALGAAAILLGNLWALTQERLKLLVAYSTVAQIGYLFLIFPLAVGESSGLALAAGIVQAISHACAKAAMFLAAGLIAVALGHDRLRDLGGLGRAMPLTVLGLALAGLALAGLQPSGGYVVKSLIQTAALETGQWWWGPVLDLGGLLTAAYLARVLGLALGPALAPTLGTGVRVAEVPGIVERPRPVQVTVVLLLALCALLLGLLPPDLVAVLGLGREGPDASQAVGAAMGGAFDSGSLWSSLGPMLAVALVVLIWGGRGSLAGVLARPLTWLDGGLRQWRVAGLALLILTLALAGGLIGGSLGHA